MLGFTKATLAVVALAGSATAQTDFYDEPSPKWTQLFVPMGDNNGLVMSPDDMILYATSSDGTLAAMKPATGEIYWDYQPSGDGTVPFSSNGMVSIAEDLSFVAFGVTEGEECRVHTLSHPDGEPLWSSNALEGACEGTPNISSDGTYVFVTHNSAAGTVGHFTVLEVDSTGDPFYTYMSTDGPFSPPGFYRTPNRGNYPAGIGNTNDISVWGFKPTPTAEGGESGGLFAFQMPPSTAVGDPAVVELIAFGSTDWRSTAPPLLAAGGQDLFWDISRSKINSWVGGTAFTQGRSGTWSFDRGRPPFKAAPYTPAVNDLASPTIVCGGPANEAFACFNALDISVGPTWQAATSPGGLVIADPLFNPEGDRVYYSDSVGLITSADPSDGTVFFNASTATQLEANMAMTSDGSILYFGDISGNVVAWEVATPINDLPDIPDLPGDETEMPTPGTDDETTGAPSSSAFISVTFSMVAVGVSAAFMVA